MKRKALAFLLLAACAVTYADDRLDADGYPVMYLRGSFGGHNWECDDNYKFTRSDNLYSLTVDELDGEFKISGTDWKKNYGADRSGVVISGATVENGVADGANFTAARLENVTIEFSYTLTDGKPLPAQIRFITSSSPSSPNLSGTLPVLYINVKNPDGTLNNEIIDRNLSHKDYLAGEYWLDLNGCHFNDDFEPIGSAETPLPLEIKARGNYTRTAFAKKPFKLKLGKKQNMLGLTPEKSKHYAILAHADDNKGFLRNFTGFNLGKRIGLPWTPSQQPVEVVINGDYRGLYFLTESVRIGDGRIDIAPLDDNCVDPALIDGGYLVELDNYDEENQIRIDEKGQADCRKDKLRITFDTPESYSDPQREFVTKQFTAMNDLIGENSDLIWNYIDIDDAAKYYLVEEIISHTEAFHGSTYMFRDRGNDKKWHFSPLWDCGNAFNGSTSGHFYVNSPFGNTWIPSLRLNNTFNSRIKEIWNDFMKIGYSGIEDDIAAFADAIATAAKHDRKRWKSSPVPDGGIGVMDNSDMAARKREVIDHLRAKVEWMKGVFGDFTSEIEDVIPDNQPCITKFYNLQGIRVDNPQPGAVYLKVTGDKAVKEIYR